MPRKKAMQPLSGKVKPILLVRPNTLKRKVNIKRKRNIVRKRSIIKRKSIKKLTIHQLIHILHRKTTIVITAEENLREENLMNLSVKILRKRAIRKFIY